MRSGTIPIMDSASYLKSARAETLERKVISPEVLPNHQVVFRFRAPQARQVRIIGQFLDEDVPLLPDKNGLWSITLGPLPPGIYQYSFSVYSRTMIDPSNCEIKPMHHPYTSILSIPGDPPLLHDFQDCPHGTLHRHWYYSSALSKVRSIEVYTPPGYENETRRYPTLYLIPGSGEMETIWTVFGRVHWILDNLIARGLASPMILAMIDGEAV